MTADDFFSAAPTMRSVDVAEDNMDTFAQAIAGRFNQSGKGGLLTARLSPAVTINMVTSPSPAMSLKSPPSKPRKMAAAMSVPGPSTTDSRFTAASAASLPGVFSTPHVLILDIRPHSAYTTARLPNALSLSVPSTLLKRPAFTLQKLGTMLSSCLDRERFSAWKAASRILVYDADSTSLQEGSNILGLLRKFQAEGFTGNIAWLQGGIQALWRDHRHLVDQTGLSDDEEDAEEDSCLRARDLPKAAFQQSTTIALHSAPLTVQPKTQKSNSQQPALSKRTAANPFYDNIRQNMELSQGITERIPLKLPSDVIARQADLPFEWLRSIACAADREEGTEALAMQFYRIELGEQRRLQGVMLHHSQQTDENTNSGTSQNFPFSITAGVEKGVKNRYRNIWPFEHARVRLHSQSQDDYVNASYVQPLGTRRRYIATQGPLASTFNDFWTLVWEQNVRVIVMLTKEMEGAVAKCGNYWQEGHYGSMRLKLTSSNCKSEHSSDVGNKGLSSASGFDFFLPPTVKGESAAGEDEDITVRRTFELSHAEHPNAPPRIITQLQYLGWPDMNVPDTPKGLLKLIKDVHQVSEDEGVDGRVKEDANPVLLHCSAGVGRTGGFIMVDAILDGIRGEMRKLRSENKSLTRTGEIEAASGNASSQNAEGTKMSGDWTRLGRGSMRTTYGSENSDMMDVDAHFASGGDGPTSTSMPTVPSNIQTGLFAPLAVGKINSAAAPQEKDQCDNNLDIHVPLVPSSERSDVLTFWKKDGNSQSGSDSKGSSTAKTTSLPQTSTTTSPRVLDSDSPLVPPLTSRTSGNPSTSSGSTGFSMSTSGTSDAESKKDSDLASGFTIADADSMFITAHAPDLAFAMDVEQQQQQRYGEGRVHINADTDMEYKSDMKTRGGFGTSAMSSSDELYKNSSDSDSYAPQGRRGSGGYSSSSSLGLRAFAGLSTSSVPMRSSNPTSAPQSMTQGMSKRRLLAPTSLPLPPPQSAPDAPVKVKARSADVSGSGSSRNAMTRVLSTRNKPQDSRSSNFTYPSHMSSSSSSLPTTYALSPLFSPYAESSAMPMSQYDSSSPSPPEKKSAASDVFDYTAPRELHRMDSPPPLSTFQEPIRQVLEDMREQRMSLCQSLRQYVFVHRAIIEGALEIVDEERNAAAKEQIDEEPESMTVTMSIARGHPPAAGFESPMKSKRGASPTELPKKSKKGEVMLSKRPSIKRGKSESSNTSACAQLSSDSP